VEEIIEEIRRQTQMTPISTQTALDELLKDLRTEEIPRIPIFSSLPGEVLCIPDHQVLRCVFLLEITAQLIRRGKVLKVIADAV
jgi:hypothetical protein